MRNRVSQYGALSCSRGWHESCSAGGAMNWLTDIGGLLHHYAEARPSEPSATAERDFELVAHRVSDLYARLRHPTGRRRHLRRDRYGGLHVQRVGSRGARAVGVSRRAEAGKRYSRALL